MAKSNKRLFAQCSYCLEDFESTKVWVELVQNAGGPNYFAGVCEACAKENGIDVSNLETDLVFHRRINKRHAQR